MEKGGDYRCRYPKLTIAGESAALLSPQWREDGESLVVRAATVTKLKEHELYAEIGGVKDLMRRCDLLAIGVSRLLRIRARIPMRPKPR